MNRVKESTLRRLRLLPFISGSAWLITLSSLLFYWLANGRPRYPLQNNPYVAFISNIGAFHLRPLFIIGCFITAVTFTGTICGVHFIRHYHYGYADRDSGRHYQNAYQAVSLMAVLSAITAGTCLAMLSVYDTFHYHAWHKTLLFSCFLTLAISAFGTFVVYIPHLKKPTRFQNLRRWVIASNAISLVETAIGISMMFMSSTNHLRISGILEWALSYLGVFYLWTFVGYFNIPQEEITEIDERTSLLR